MLFPLLSPLYWSFCYFLKGLWFAKNQDIRWTTITPSRPPATPHCRTALLDAWVHRRSSASFWSPPRCVSQPEASFYSTGYSCCASGMLGAPVSKSHSSQRLVSFQGRRAAPHGGARKAQDGDAAQRSCSGFKGDQGGKICWCCIQHRRRGWLLSTLRASALKPNFPWPSLFHSVDLHPLATCKNREMSVSAQLQIQIKKRGCT